MFLKKIDYLQQALEKESGGVLWAGLPYIKVFRAFSDVVEFSFGVSLKEGYAEKIQDFKKFYLALEISVTPKVKFDYFFIYSYLNIT